MGTEQGLRGAVQRWPCTHAAPQRQLFGLFLSESPNFFFLGCAKRLPGSQCPDQGLNPSRGSASLESWPLGCQGAP